MINTPSPINTTDNIGPMNLISWNDNDSNSKNTAFGQYDVSKFDGIVHRKTTASYLNTFQNIDNSTSVRDGFTKRDYNYFRPNEMAPWMSKDIIRTCMMAYDRVGLVKNVIDMMADFTSQGIEIVHPVPKIQRLCRKWFKMVCGKERSERLANMLYRSGNVIVKRVMAEIPQTELAKMYSAHAADDSGIDIRIDKEYQGQIKDKNKKELKLAEDLEKKGRTIQHRGGQIDIEYPDTPPQPPNQIPVRYTILNPVMVEAIGGELAPFVSDVNYGLIIPNQIVTKIRNPQPLEMSIINQIPMYIRDWIFAGPVAGKILPLPMDRIITMFYKKDDWQLWANPLIYSIMDDLIMLEKMKLADLAALDGIISQVRIWKLGSLEHKILPTGPMIQKLANILLNNTGGGVIDMIWGPELELQETNTTAHKFLGKTKYEPVLNAIYDGLGIPPTMTAAGSAGGFTNNYISLKTLIERLNYGRDMITSFWEREFEILRQALGIKKAPRLRFNYMSLTDENVEKKLLLDMADRGLLSDETLWERFKEVPAVERARLMSEQNARKGGRQPRKAGPWHKPEFYDDLAKIALQTGQATPSEVGLDLEENQEGQKPMIDKQMEGQLDLQKTQQQTQIKLAKTKVAMTPPAKGPVGQGRPAAKKDSTKRAPKQVKPRQSVKGSAAFMNAQLWAQSAYKEIADIIHPVMLQLYNKANMRQLNAAEAEEVENVKFGVLFNLVPFSDINEETVAQIFIDKRLSVPEFAIALYKEMNRQFIEQFNTSPSIEDLRIMQTSVYSLLQTDAIQGDIENE